MERKLSKAEIQEKLPHIDSDVLGGRCVPLHCLYDEQGNWNLWIQTNDSRLLKIPGVPVEANYYSKSPANEDDLRLPLIEFLDQRASYSEINTFSKAVLSDVHNLGASLDKLELIFKAGDKRAGLGRMAATELEYIFLCCRSLFDVVQEIISILWSRIKLNISSLNHRNLTSTYTKMVMRDGRLMSVDQIIAKHQIPEEVAVAYHRSGEFFEWLRQYRDFIAHGGKDFERIYVAESGFAVPVTVPPFSNMKIWCDENMLPHNLGSLKSVACHIVVMTLDILDSLVDSLQKTIRFLPPIAPGYNVYICGPNIRSLKNASRGISDDPWFISRVQDSGMTGKD